MDKSGVLLDALASANGTAIIKIVVSSHSSAAKIYSNPCWTGKIDTNICSLPWTAFVSTLIWRSQPFRWNLVAACRLSCCVLCKMYLRAYVNGRRWWYHNSIDLLHYIIAASHSRGIVCAVRGMQTHNVIWRLHGFARWRGCIWDTKYALTICFSGFLQPQPFYV